MSELIKSDGTNPHKPLKKQCFQCGEQFTVSRRDQLYCSAKCRDYYNNHKGIKGKSKAESPHKKNLRILKRLSRGKELFEVKFDKLEELGFELGLACEVIKKEDRRIWRVCEEYCYWQDGEGFMFFLGRHEIIPKKEPFLPMLRVGLNL